MKIAERLIQNNENEDDVLHNKLFNVNIRMFKGNKQYRNLILHCCDYMKSCLTTYDDYGQCKGMSGANIGVPYNIICVLCNNEKEILINPTIIETSKHYEIKLSNCGSLQLKEKIAVKRPTYIIVSYYSIDGVLRERKFTTLSGTVQHEIEHNLGILIIDK